MSKKEFLNDTISSSLTGGRLKRYAKVTTAIGGLAAKLAGEKYLGIKVNREHHAKQLKEALGGIRDILLDNTQSYFLKDFRNIKKC